MKTQDKYNLKIKNGMKTHGFSCTANKGNLKKIRPQNNAEAFAQSHLKEKHKFGPLSCIKDPPHGGKNAP